LPEAPVALVSGADRGLGLALTEGLLRAGWRVFAGQYMADWPELAKLQQQYGESLVLVPLDVGDTVSVRVAAAEMARLTERLDLLISNAGIGSREGDLESGLDYAAIENTYNVNTLGLLRLVEAMLPLLERSTLKRIAIVSSEAGCITLAHRDSGFGYGMSKAALNMVARLLFNDLRPQGYTFRLYHPGWMNGYMSGSKGTHGDMEPEEAAVPALAYFTGDREDEDRLALVDYMGSEWPF
jgi:NAD(P)-dependent dehydrogenase (short-subunit alcohol dehydrogenase family)